MTVDAKNKQPYIQMFPKEKISLTEMGWSAVFDAYAERVYYEAL